MSDSDDVRVAWGRKEEGDKLFEKGDFEGAIDCYSKALELYPRDPDLWNVKGMALSKLKRYDEAIKCYDIALEHYPRETIVWINKGVALNNAGKQIEAIRLRLESSCSCSMFKGLRDLGMANSRTISIN
jgi:tetratricopeptide (TPR) repeat protein